VNGEVYVRGERAYKFQADVATIDAVSHPNSVLQVVGTCLLFGRVSTTILQSALKLKVVRFGPIPCLRTEVFLARSASSRVL
jgi:hypothetical protein